MNELKELKFNNQIAYKYWTSRNYGELVIGLLYGDSGDIVELHQEEEDGEIRNTKRLDFYQATQDLNKLNKLDLDFKELHHEIAKELEDLTNDSYWNKWTEQD